MPGRFWRWYIITLQKDRMPAQSRRQGLASSSIRLPDRSAQWVIVPCPLPGPDPARLCFDRVRITPSLAGSGATPRQHEVCRAETPQPVANSLARLQGCRLGRQALVEKAHAPPVSRDLGRVGSFGSFLVSRLACHLSPSRAAYRPSLTERPSYLSGLDCSGS